MRKDYNLEQRKYVIGGFVVLIVIIYIIRLAQLQLGDSSYQGKADSNAYVKETIYPERGFIYDRNNKLIVYNEPAYDLVMIPHDVEPFDTTDFCTTLQISRADLEKKLEEIKESPLYSPFQEQTVISRLTPQDYGRIQEKLRKFHGFHILQKFIRKYNYAAAGNLLGDIREVNEKDVEEEPGYYKAGDLIGDQGIERSYEKYIRGKKGVEIFIREASGNRTKYEGGKYDTLPTPGNNLKLCIDIDLQQYGEALLRNKCGAAIAIDYQTGEILAMCSSPTFDPTLLVDKDRGKNYSKLAKDQTKPLYNRAIQAAYPPGSTFKPTQGLIFQQEGIIDTTTYFPCNHGYQNFGMHVGCHGHSSPITLKPALATSCNGYFCWGFFRMMNNKKYGGIEQAFEVWKKYLVSMGYGYKLGVDLPYEARGFIPNVQYYNKYLGQGKWGANSVVSISIGQGEVLATPLQIANLCATIANRGYYYIPHIVKNVMGIGILKKYTERHNTLVNPKYYNSIIEGMRKAVLGGTCKGANLPGILVYGKTGTAQNPHGRDHSAFMGFASNIYVAPNGKQEKRRIAIAVYVENAGFGADYGVPIGSLMMEKYLTGTVTRTDMESRMMHSSTLQYGNANKDSNTSTDNNNSKNNKNANSDNNSTSNSNKNKKK